MDNDCDGLVDEGFPDADGDGLKDCRDDCDLVWNPDQADGDHNGVGDACEEAALFSRANVATAGFSAGRVDGRDLEVFAAAFGTCPGDPGFSQGANLDQVPPAAGRPGACVGMTDFHLFMDQFARIQ